MTSRKLIFFAALTFLFASCGEFVRIQQSPDASLKYSYAKKFYNERKYSKAASLLEDVRGIYDGTSEGEQLMFLLAECYLEMRRDADAGICYQEYYNKYPKGLRAEEAHYKAGYCFYEASPDSRLDQSDTYLAIQELQSYLDFFPNGKYAKEAENMLFGLQDKLAYKEYRTAKLYYNLGLYLGNNYRSCIVTAEAALKTYPYTKHREELVFLMLQAMYEEASFSVSEKLQTRYRDVADQYFAYINEFPNGKYLKQAKKIYDSVSKHISQDA